MLPDDFGVGFAETLVCLLAITGMLPVVAITMSFVFSRRRNWITACLGLFSVATFVVACVLAWTTPDLTDLTKPLWFVEAWRVLLLSAILGLGALTPRRDVAPWAKCLTVGEAFCLIWLLGLSIAHGMRTMN